MAKLSSYLKMSGIKNADGSLVVNIFIRKWHPVFWWICVVAFFRAVASRG